MWKKGLALATALALCAGPAVADRGGRGGKHRGRGNQGYDQKGHGNGGHGAYGYGYRYGPYNYRPYYRAPYYGKYRYGYYGGHHDNDDAYLWLGVAALAVGVVSALSVQQQALHQQSYWGATTAPIGSPVSWNDRGAAGAWTPVSESYSPGGDYCREFQQEVRVGGRTERGYGTACWRPDGSWEIVD